MKLKILVLGNKNVNRRVVDSLKNTEVELACETDIFSAVNRMRLEKYDLALIDSGMSDLESICHRINWLQQTPIALIIKGEAADWSTLKTYDVEGFIPEEAGNIEMIAYFQSIVRRTANRIKKINLLVVEDDEYTSEALRLSFEIYWPDASITFARSGEEGLKAARSRRLDIILLDLCLPDMSGLEVLKILKISNAAPVIMISADRSKENIVNSILLGASDYVLKPYRQLELMSRIRTQVNVKYPISVSAN